MAATRRRSRRRGDVSFYLSQQNLTPEERAQVAHAGRLEGVEAEIALLRVLIQRTMKGQNQNDTQSKEQTREARLHIETLCKALRLQHLLSGRSGDAMSDSLARLLDEIGVQSEAEP